MNIYSIYDSPAEYFLPPFFARTHGQAQRMFVGSMGDTFPHRAGFGLHHIGIFDEDTGKIEGIDHVLILAGLSIPPEADPRVPPPQILDPQPTPEIQSNGAPS